ncbi:MAG: type II toxin-antitoxin system RelE/ParE family toxin [Candidatus Chisholmbacteria bacterium]|nr:type II toxin-antitoxin system RelE/ParE family toxin [Candidatus Chisholmbacteria bacterium]
MKYRLRYAKTAVRDIKKLDRVMQKRLKRKLELFLTDPRAYATKLSSSKLGGYRFRLGDLRVIFDLEGAWVTILRVGFRGDIYK